MATLFYVILALHIIVCLWAHNFYTFLIFEPLQVKRKRLLMLWFIPIYGLLPILHYRKVLIENSKNSALRKNLNDTEPQDK